MNNKFTAQQLARYIDCDRSTIFNYINKGLPYELGYIEENGVMNRAIRLFNKSIALEWLIENGSKAIKEKIGGISIELCEIKR